MNFHKVSVSVDGQALEAVVKEGILATIEIGKHVNKAEAPLYKIWILSGQSDGKATAWVQLAAVEDDKSLSITHGGWIGGGREELPSLSTMAPTKASVEAVQDIPEKSRQSLERVKPGSFGCCTAYGKNCYVKCCNSCCADPVRCPGASCCG